jgi:sialidase-1
MFRVIPNSSSAGATASEGESMRRWIMAGVVCWSAAAGMADTPMRIVSVTTEQQILPVLIGNPVNPIARVRIETKGAASPLSIQKMTFTLSSSADRRDIAGARVFHGTKDRLGYRRPNLCFDKNDRVGAPQSPAARVSFEGNRELNPGVNYMWLSVELTNAADVDGWIDAGCERVSFSDGTVTTPDVTEPPGRLRFGVAVQNDDDTSPRAFRIPGIITTKPGTLIGVYDIRHRSWSDLPADIDVGMSRSTDGGRTWAPMRTIMGMGNDKKWKYDGIGDPCILYDRGTETIWVAAIWSHGERGWKGSGPGLEPEETGQLVMVKSEDDGLTWSKPINVTKQVKDPAWSLLLASPGRGITMTDGTIVMPAQFRDTPDTKGTPYSTIIYSRDHGATWAIGTGAQSETNECQVVELAPGTLMLNMRNRRGGGRIVSITTDMGRTWQRHPTSEKVLPEPICNAGLVKVKSGDDPAKPWLAFINPAVDMEPRRSMTVKLSTDGGMSWPADNHILLDQGQSAGYPSPTMIDDRTIGVFYEGSRANITFQRIPIQDFFAKQAPGKGP